MYYEWCAWLGIVPGALGIVLRKLFWPRLFGCCGKGVVFGANVVLRQPHRMELGERVVISDGCILDARNEEVDCAIRIGSDTILSNQVMMSCKGGSISIGKNTGIGAYTVIHSVNDCPVPIGEDVMIGPKCYITGGGNYNVDRLDIPMAQQGLKKDSGVRLAGDNWLGANVTVLSGITMGRGSIAAAGAVVTKSMDERAICGGVPATVMKFRGDS
jgi:galactoside O-acetyltransferase